MDSSKLYRYRDTFLKITIPLDLHNHGYDERVTPELALGTDVQANRDAVIFRLPTEITAKIFRFTQNEYNGDFVARLGGWWCWLTITHVCKLWRKIAIRSQELWTYIDIQKLSGMEQMEAYMERSGTSEIVVDYTLTGGNPDSFGCLIFALGQMHRIRELYITELPSLGLKRRDWEELRVALCRAAAPAMRKFVFQSDDARAVDARTLFQGKALNLEKLCLAVNSPSWANVSIMQNLRYLSIDTKRNALDLGTAIAIFAENVNIETVSMNSLQGVSYGGGSRTPIRLPYLKDLTITADYDVLCRLFRNIVTPSLMGWMITCTTYPVDLSTNTNPKSVLPQEYAKKTCKSLKLAITPLYVLVTANDPSGIAMELDNEVYPHRELVCSWEEVEDEEAAFGVAAVDKLDHICALMKGGFWCSAEALTVETRTDVSDDDNPVGVHDLGCHPWRRLLNLFPALQELTVQHIDSIDQTVVEASHRGLLEALNDTHVDDSGTSILMNPRLRDLCLVGMDLEVGLVYLSEALKTRAERGSRLCNLLLDDPLGVTELALCTLDDRELVERIEIDGVPLG